MSDSDNLHNYLKFWAEYEPKRIAVRSTSGTLTYLQLFKLVQKVAGQLDEQGVKPGQVVYINLPQLQDIVMFLALNQIGAKCAYHFNGYDSALPVTADLWIKSNERSDIAGTKSITINQEWWASVEKGHEREIAHAWERDEICYYIYTSGTTGSFKSIGLTFSHLIEYDAKTTSPWEQSGLTFSLFGWSGGFAQFLTTLIVKGRPILVNNSPSDVQELFDKTKPTNLLGSPSLLAAFIEKAALRGTDLTSTEHVVSMGGQLSPKLVLNLRKSFPKAKITNLYGSSEGGRIAAQRITRPNQGAMAGAILPEARVEIVDDHGNRVPQGTSGKVRYKSLVNEYVNDPEASSKVFRDGWFYCGDLGHLDENYCLVLEGRESEVLNIGGEKLDPLIIDEFVISQSGVIDCGTFPIQTNSGRQSIGIAVVADSDFDAQQLRTAVLAKFPNAVPLAIIKAEKIPKTSMGKIMRKLLSKQFEEFDSKSTSN